MDVVTMVTTVSDIRISNGSNDLNNDSDKNKIGHEKTTMAGLQRPTGTRTAAK